EPFEGQRSLMQKVGPMHSENHALASVKNRLDQSGRQVCLADAGWTVDQDGLKASCGHAHVHPYLFLVIVKLRDHATLEYRAPRITSLMRRSFDKPSLAAISSELLPKSDRRRMPKT